MDRIRQIIQSLREDEKKEFRLFTNRMRTRKNRLDLQLFDLLNQDKELKGNQIMLDLYGDEPNRVAYHAVRRRLTNHLLQFIRMKNLQYDESGRAEIVQYLELAQFLLNRKENEGAWHYLEKSEGLARKRKQYDLLHQTLMLQMTKIHRNDGADFGRINTELKNNRDLVERSEKAERSIALLRYKLATARREGTEPQLERLIRSILKEAGTETEYWKSARMVLAAMTVVRSNIMGRREAGPYAKFLSSTYEEFKEKTGFKKSDAAQQANMLYIVAHSQYRNWQFASCRQYVIELQNLLNGAGLRYQSLYLPRIQLMRNSLHFFEGELREGIDLASKMLESPKDYHLKPTDVLDLRMQNALACFAAEDYEKVLDLFLDVAHTDQWLGKKMGKEWLLKKQLIELIAHHEYGNVEFALNRTKALERQFRELASNSLFERGLKYVQFLRKYFQNNSWLNPESLENQIDKALEVYPQAQEDLQVVSFYAYFRAKAYKVPYYEMIQNIFGRGDHF
ncbi:hypothetical protein N8482_01440 [Chitinophagales bacterium]|nr:hypothetical protein [Chitinophagales bacterium]